MLKNKFNQLYFKHYNYWNKNYRIIFYNILKKELLFNIFSNSRDFFYYKNKYLSQNNYKKKIYWDKYKKKNNILSLKTNKKNNKKKFKKTFKKKYVKYNYIKFNTLNQKNAIKNNLKNNQKYKKIKINQYFKNKYFIKQMQKKKSKMIPLFFPPYMDFNYKLLFFFLWRHPKWTEIPLLTKINSNFIFGNNKNKL